uniref:Uncharacterized protein n=1 Tax=Anguilla anguilla TaxID=7936 RepID=A0A0E9XCS7_ANGAN
MQLDLFHFYAHKLGFYLKVPNFLTGRDFKHDVLKLVGLQSLYFQDDSLLVQTCPVVLERLLLGLPAPFLLSLAVQFD